jgi:hypothetical protein
MDPRDESTGSAREAPVALLRAKLREAGITEAQLNSLVKGSRSDT